jgi:hypothetical protein
MKKLFLPVTVGVLLGVLGKLAFRRAEVADPAGDSPAGKPALVQGSAGERKASNQSRIPGFVTTKPLDRVPGSPGYDPVRFMSVMPVTDLFDQEPRDPVWAPAMEQGLLAMLKRDLARLQAARDVAVECRTTGCRFSWNPDDDPNLKTLNFLIQLYSGAGSGGGRRLGYLVSFFKGGTLSEVATDDPPTLLAALQKRRDERLAVVRKREKAGHLLYPKIPMSEWPD